MPSYELTAVLSGPLREDQVDPLIDRVHRHLPSAAPGFNLLTPARVSLIDQALSPLGALGTFEILLVEEHLTPTAMSWRLLEGDVDPLNL